MASRWHNVTWWSKELILSLPASHQRQCCAPETDLTIDGEEWEYNRKLCSMTALAVIAHYSNLLLCWLFYYFETMLLYIWLQENILKNNIKEKWKDKWFFHIWFNYKNIKKKIRAMMHSSILFLFNQI